MKNKKIDRINRAIGQLESLKKEISKEDYDCEAIITQIKASIGAIKSLGKLIAQEDLEKCLNKTISREKQEDRLKNILDAISF